MTTTNDERRFEAYLDWCELWRVDPEDPIMLAWWDAGYDGVLAIEIDAR